MRIFLKTIFNSAEATQVNISAASGDMGILANHVPSVEPLRPGVLEVIESNGQSQKWFGKLLITLGLGVSSLVTLADIAFQ